MIDTQVQIDDIVTAFMTVQSFDNFDIQINEYIRLTMIREEYYIIYNNDGIIESYKFLSPFGLRGILEKIYRREI